MEKNLYEIIKSNNNIEKSYSEIMYLLIRQNNLQKYIKNVLITDLKDSFGLYSNDRKLYIHKYIKEILYYKYKKENIKSIMDLETYITINVLITLLHETHHAIQEKQIHEKKDIKTQILKDTRNIKSTESFYKIDPNEKDACMASFTFLIKYLIINKYDNNVIEYFTNIYNKKIIPRGYINGNLTIGTLNIVYKDYLQNLKRYINIKDKIEELTTYDKLSINESIKR